MLALRNLVAVAAAMLSEAQATDSEASHVLQSDFRGPSVSRRSLEESFGVEHAVSHAFATFEPEEALDAAKLSRRLSTTNGPDAFNSELTQVSRLGFNGKDSLGGHISFEAKTSVREEVVNLDKLVGVEQVDCKPSGEGANALVLIRIQGYNVAEQVTSWGESTILVASSQWKCGPEEASHSPLYAQLMPGAPASWDTADTLARPVGAGADRGAGLPLRSTEQADPALQTAVVRVKRVNMQDCFHSFSMSLKRSSQQADADATVVHGPAPAGSAGGRTLLQGSIGSGYTPYSWEFGRNAVGRASWNVAAPVNGTADPSQLTVARPRIPIANSGGHLLTCINCYAWVAADVHVRGEFGWGTASSLEVFTGLYTSARFEIEAVMNATIGVTRLQDGFVNVTTWVNVTNNTEVFNSETNTTSWINTTSMVEGWRLEPRFTNVVAEQGSASIVLLPAVRVMTIEFVASGVPVSVPVTARMDLGVNLAYNPPANTSIEWDGVVTNAGVDVSGKALIGASCKAGRGCGPIRQEGLTVQPLRPLYDLPGQGSSSLSLRVQPVLAVTASVFGGWDVTMSAQPYSTSAAQTGPEIAAACGTNQSSWGAITYNNSRVFASLRRGMLSSVQLEAPGAALTLGPACRDGGGCIGPFTFFPGPYIQGQPARAVTLGPYAVVPEDAVPSSTSTGCVGNGLAFPTSLGSTTANVSAICSLVPGACDYIVGDWDTACDIDCNARGTQARTVQCRVRYTTPDGVSATFLASREVCLLSPTAPRPAPLATQQCPRLPVPSSLSPSCAAVRFYASPSCQENSTQVTVQASRRCQWVPEFGLWVQLIDRSPSLDLYVCSRADCPIADVNFCSLRSPPQIDAGQFCQQNDWGFGRLGFFAATLPPSTASNPQNMRGYVAMPLDGGTTILLETSAGPTQPANFRYFQVAVSGAIDSVTVNAVITQAIAGSPDPAQQLRPTDFQVYMSTTRFICDDQVDNQCARQPSFGLPTTGFQVADESTGLDAIVGAVSAGTLSKQITARNTALEGWGRFVYIAVRCMQRCTVSAAGYIRSAPGQGFVGAVGLMPLESRQLLYRPSPDAVGVSMLVTTLGPLTTPRGTVSSNMLVRAVVPGVPFTFPRLTDLGRANVTASQILAARAQQLVPLSYRATLNVDAPVRGLTLLAADGFSTSTDYLVSLASTSTDYEITGRADHLVQAFDLFPLVPGQPKTAALPSNAKVAFIVRVPGTSTGLQVMTTPTRGSVDVCVSPGLGLYSIPQSPANRQVCGSVVGGVNTLNVPAAGSAWLAGSRELTVLISALTDTSFTIVALPLEVLDPGVPVTRTVKRSSRLTFAGPTELPATAAAYGSATAITGYERLSWAANVAVGGQAPAPVSMYAGTLSQYPNLPSEAGAESFATSLGAGTAAQLAGAYQPFSRVHPVMLNVVPSPHSSLITGTFKPDQLMMVSPDAAFIPSGNLGLILDPRPNPYARMLKSVAGTKIAAPGSSAHARLLQDVPLGASMAVNAPDMYLYAPWASAWLPGNSSVDHCSAPGVGSALLSAAKDYGMATCAQVWIEPAWSTAASVSNGGLTYLVVLPPATQARVQLMAPFNPGNSSSATPTVPAPLWSVCADAPVTSSDCVSPDFGVMPVVKLVNCGASPRGFRISVQALTPMQTIQLYSQYLYITVAYRPVSFSTSPCPAYRWQPGPWSACGDLCRESRQTRTLHCIEEKTGVTVDMGLCPAVRPAISRVCNNGPCVIQTSPWSECTRPCAWRTTDQQWSPAVIPYQYRTASCVNGGGTGVQVPEHLCTFPLINATTGGIINTTTVTNTALVQQCVGLDICAPTTQVPPVGYWWLSDWSACSAFCDGGVQTRRAYCGNADAVPLDEIWCLRVGRPVLSRPCALAPCGETDVTVTFADVRRLSTGVTAVGLPPVVERIPAGGMKFFTAARATRADEAVCVDALVTGVSDNCTSASLADLASCASALQGCLSTVPINRTAMSNAGVSASLLPFGFRQDQHPFAVARYVCDCYAAAQVCAATRRCSSANFEAERLVISLTTSCQSSTCPTVNAGACSPRPDVRPAPLGLGQPLVHMYANRIKAGQTLSSVPIPTGHDSAEIHVGSWTAGRQSVCVNGSEFGADTDGILVGIKAPEAGITVAVTAVSLAPVNATSGVPPIIALSGGLYTGETFFLNITVPPRLEYNARAQRYLPVTNLTWFAQLVESRAVADTNVTQGGLNMTIELFFDAFVDPNGAMSAQVASVYGLPSEKTRVHRNALLTGMRPVTVGAEDGRAPEGGWEKVALPFLLSESAPQAVFFDHGSSTAVIILPPIPGYAPRSSESFTFTIAGQFLRSGRDQKLDKFFITFQSTGARDCVVGSWTEWSPCPAVPCTAPGQGNPLGGVPLPALQQMRNRAVVVAPRGDNVLQCPVLSEVRPCNPCNPCAGVRCDNGGVCIDGQCACPPGYGGPDCSLPPRAVAIWTSWTESAWTSCLEGSRSGSGRRYRFVNCTDVAGLPNPWYIENRTVIVPTPTASNTATPSGTRPFSLSPTASTTSTGSLPAGVTASNSPSESPTPSTTRSATPSTTSTPSESVTPTQTPTISFTSTVSASNTGTPTPSTTETPSPTRQPGQPSWASNTPSITPSNFWFNTTVNATMNATVIVPVYAPSTCGPIAVPGWWEWCPLPGVPRLSAPRTALGNVTVMRVTIPLMEALGVNASSLLRHAEVQDAYQMHFVAHLARAANLIPGSLLPVGLARCAPANFVPSGQDRNNWVLRTTPSASPLNVPLRPQTGQLQGAPPVVCLTVEYVEDVARQGVTAVNVLYRLAVLMGASIDNMARTGGADLRPVRVTGVQRDTHLLTPLTSLAIPEGNGYVNFSFLAVATDPFGRPSQVPGVGGTVQPEGFITDLPGLSPGFMPSGMVPSVDSSLPTVRNALIAFAVLFAITFLVCMIYYRARGFSDRAPRPPPSKPRRGTLGEVINPLSLQPEKASSSKSMLSSSTPIKISGPTGTSQQRAASVELTKWNSKTGMANPLASPAVAMAGATASAAATAAALGSPSGPSSSGAAGIMTAVMPAAAPSIFTSPPTPVKTTV